jgi:two-component system cell cycle response regulator DivK
MNGKHVLVVDDDESILEVVKIVLEEEGYVVTAISDYEEIDQEIVAKSPDIIVLDIYMPGRNGAEITRQLKTHQYSAHIPIIIASAGTELKSIAEQVGADGYLEKPFEIEELVAVIKNHIQ